MSYLFCLCALFGGWCLPVELSGSNGLKVLLLNEHFTFTFSNFVCEYVFASLLLLNIRNLGLSACKLIQIMRCDLVSTDLKVKLRA